MNILHVLNPANGKGEIARQDNPVPVYGPGEYAASSTVTLKRDLSTTMQTMLYPSGAKWAKLVYRLLPGATAVTNQFAKFVINASSDADATGKLALDGAFYPIAQGDEFDVAAQVSDPILRIDFVAEQAVGAEKTIFSVIAGV